MGSLDLEGRGMLERGIIVVGAVCIMWLCLALMVLVGIGVWGSFLEVFSGSC